MKRIWILLLIAPLFSAKVDRTKAPEAGPAPEVKIGEVQSFELENGLKVFVVENHKLPTLSVSLRVDVKPILEKERAGYVEIAGELLMHGTKNRTKAQLDEEIDYLGARVATGSDGLYAQSLSKHREALFNIISDIVLNPSFPQEELEKVKSLQSASLQSAKDDPAQILSRVLRKTVYGEKHPYGELKTEETLATITVKDCIEYYQTYFRPNISYLSIVGDITLQQAKELTEKYLGSWQKKDVPQQTYTQPEKPAKTKVILVNKEGAVQTNLALINLTDYRMSDDTYLQGRVMNVTLGGGAGRRLYNNLREDKGFTYGAYSRLNADQLVGSFQAKANVRNDVTTGSVKAFLEEFGKIRKDVPTEEEVNSVKATLAGSFARSLEEPRTLSRFAINTAIYGLKPTFYHDYLKNLSLVTPEQIQKAAQEHIHIDNGYIIAVGNAAELSASLKEFGEITVVDINGNEVKLDIKVPEGVTAKSVLEGYLNFLGGREKLDKITSCVQKGAFLVPGQSLGYMEAKVLPDKSFMSLSANGQVMTKQVLNGDKGYMTQMGNRKDLSKEEIVAMKNKVPIFPEVFWLDKNYKMELSGAEEIDGQPAYKVVITDPQEQTQTCFYEMKTFKKLRTTLERPSQMGPLKIVIDIRKYREIDQVMIPSEMLMQQGPQFFQIKLNEIKLNSELDMSLFKVD
ncbi:MAG: peptidase M16 [Acidobacteria bacterium]|nr:MAG: peptidase M16 [Acidobacteriota bacterium]